MRIHIPVIGTFQIWREWCYECGHASWHARVFNIHWWRWRRKRFITKLQATHALASVARQRDETFHHSVVNTFLQEADVSKALPFNKIGTVKK